MLNEQVTKANCRFLEFNRHETCNLSELESLRENSLNFLPFLRYMSIGFLIN